MDSLILLLTAGACFLVFRTYKFKNRFIRWFAIVVPPLSLLVFSKVPMDIGASILYIPFLIALLWSAISLLIIVIKCLLRCGRDCKELGVRSIRPVILISVYFLVQMAHAHSLRAAKIFATEKAISIQDYCVKTSQVPTRIDDWPVGHEYSGYQSEIIHGSQLASGYPIRYSTYEKSFTVEVRINIDESFTISGGVNKEFEIGYGPYFDHKEKKIQNANDLIAFVKAQPE